jgi:hypothetical protein
MTRSVALISVASIVTAYPLAAMSVLAFGPIAIVLLSRNPLGVVVVIGLVIMGLGLAIDVTLNGMSVRPLGSAALRPALAHGKRFGRL